MAEASPAPGVGGGGAALEETDSEAEARSGVTTEPLIVNFDNPKVGKRNCSIL